MSEKNIVYSTDPKWENKCPECGEEKNKCKCLQSNSTVTNKQTVYIEKDRKRRKGKTVTLISDLRGDLKIIQKKLQQICGAGGTVKNGVIEIQGDHRVKIRQYLEKAGYQVKQRGG